MSGGEGEAVPPKTTFAYICANAKRPLEVEQEKSRIKDLAVANGLDLKQFYVELGSMFRSTLRDLLGVAKHHRNIHDHPVYIVTPIGDIPDSSMLDLRVSSRSAKDGLEVLVIE